MPGKTDSRGDELDGTRYVVRDTRGMIRGITLLLSMPATRNLQPATCNNKLNIGLIHWYLQSLSRVPSRLFEIFCNLRRCFSYRFMHSGEMQEWLNWHAWKACVPQKGTGGSNPPLSAMKNHSRSQLRDFCFTTVRTRLA